MLTSSYDTLGPDHVYHQWYPLILDSGKKAGLDFDSAPRMKGWLEEAGFINVTEYRVPWPIGTWPKDPHQREIGAFNQVRIEQGVVDFCGRRFTNNLGVRQHSAIDKNFADQLAVVSRAIGGICRVNAVGCEEQQIVGPSLCVCSSFVVFGSKLTSCRWFAYGQKPPASH